MRHRLPSEKPKPARLPIISAALKIKLLISKGERISHLVSQLPEGAAKAGSASISDNPYYRGFFQCWNEQRYYEAHDVLEQLWLKTKSEDANFFKGLIQAAGAFVHLQKKFQHPTHPKHGRRLSPAARLFRLAEKISNNLRPGRHGLDVRSLAIDLACARGKNCHVSDSR